ncbi:hypothetical protein F5Y16DRAFT_107035 [Xylariaceae sp. FL0255]|nr:hypothetical protein F5Y16DRAFT_107035 [Xylariaceae sp. FL0255]
MPYKLEVVTKPEDFGEIIPMLYAAFEEPYNPLLKWFMPITTTVEAMIEDNTTNTVKHWDESGHLHWLKVTDTETGKIVGAAQWDIRAEIDNSTEKLKPIEATSFPEGSEERVFAGKLFTSLKGFMKERMTRPHAELEQLVVAKDHRRKGIAALLVDWGKRKADEIGIESCVGSIPFAVPAYERLGYGKVDCLYPDLPVQSPSAAYSKFAAEDLHVFLMWRPVGRDWSAEDKVPWQ